MKLLGSATEMAIRDALISSASYVIENSVVIDFLERKFGRISSAYVLGHTPEQGGDVYVVLVNGSVVAKFEISRSCNSDPEDFVTMGVDEYRKVLRGLQSQLKLSIAIDLATGKSTL